MHGSAAATTAAVRCRSRNGDKPERRYHGSSEQESS
jgi:hypothetical protein